MIPPFCCVFTLHVCTEKSQLTVTILYFHSKVKTYFLTFVNCIISIGSRTYNCEASEGFDKPCVPKIGKAKFLSEKRVTFFITLSAVLGNFKPLSLTVFLVTAFSWNFVKTKLYFFYIYSVYVYLHFLQNSKWKGVVTHYSSIKINVEGSFITY